MELRLVFDCESGEVEIRRQFAGGCRVGRETPDEIEVLRAGMNDLGLRLSHPGADVGNRFVHRHWIDQDPPKGNEFWFVRVPAAGPFRHSVRAFRHFEAGPVPIRVRYYDVETNELLAERSDDAYGSSVWHSFNVPEIAGRNAVRVEVTSDSPIWAMVSVTNEETQFVTILPGRGVQPQP